MTMVSPSRTAAIGPPRAASGEMWPMRMPCDTPANRPSVISATMYREMDMPFWLEQAEAEMKENG